jgi:glycosyltransferase involved in cell wall biosynthesis
MTPSPDSSYIYKLKKTGNSVSAAEALAGNALDPGAAGRRITILHVTASPCFGGVERQMLALGHELRGWCKSVYASFLEEGRCWDFITTAAEQGWEAHALRHDTPRVLAALGELKALARRVDASILCCHGYKANLLGLLAARQLGIPILAVSHGWTAESLRVRVFEALDRRLLRRMDKVVCVSDGQAKKVRASGVPDGKVTVIRDAVRADRFNPDASGPEYRQRLEAMFPRQPSVIVGAAGRLSPEKGFRVLVDAAADILSSQRAGSENGGANVGFVLFGDGPLRGALESQILARGLQGRFHLAGFCSDLDKYYPHLDLLALPSYTEGLPNVVLEAFAAGVPVVATAVGGTPEAVLHGVNGYLVEAGDSRALSGRIADMLSDPARRREMAANGQRYVRQEFSFARQARDYRQLIESLI